jgi:AcrR family transcriptional regulator
MRIRKNAEDRKAEIAETAIRLADQVGPDRLATEQIARAIGVTQAAIFRHFPRKQDLWKAVATRIGEKLRERWLAAETAAPEPLMCLRALVIAQLGLIQRTPALPAILFSRELHLENEPLRNLFCELMNQFHHRIERQVDACQREGRLDRDIESADAAYLVIGLVQGLVLRWSLSRRHFDLPTEGQRLLDILLRSFGAPSTDDEMVPNRDLSMR